MLGFLFQTLLLQTIFQLFHQELIDELNIIFTAFDEIMAKNHCERIKTMGDGYMAVIGMPVKDPDHAENIIKAAIEIRNFISDRNKNSSKILR
ncbi:MAG: adenylate/guanylate cyclase domain-containing protein [Marinilabiliales bacterium]|nr:adenylate/guanylate cyclase domain-containing protein [Marinilabiliales bacterium]